MNKVNKLLVAMVSSASMVFSVNIFAADLCTGNNPNESNSYILDKGSKQNPDSFTCKLNGRMSFSGGDGVGAVSFGLPGGTNFNDPTNYFSTKYIIVVILLNLWK